MLGLFVDFLGAVFLLLLHARHSAGNEAFIIRLPPEMPRPHDGEVIHIAFEAKHALLFDQNGKRLVPSKQSAQNQELTLA